MVHQQKWYVVIVGKDPGVYSSWIEAGPKTKNIPGGAIYQSFLSEDEAIRMFEAANARGEVEAYPNAGKKDRSTGESRNAQLSPLGERNALLWTPSDWKEDAESTGLQTSLLSPVHSRVVKLRRTLGNSTEQCPTSSSPPTEVTQIYAPLYVDDDSPPNTPVVRPSLHPVHVPSPSGTCPVVRRGRWTETGTEEIPFQLEVSDWDLSSPTRSSSDLQPGAKEHTSKCSRRVPLHPEPPLRSIGVEYQSLSDFADMKSIDSRIWLPRSRVFDPDKVKPRPLTRLSSPAKGNTSPVASHEAFDSNSQPPFQNSVVGSPFVRADRGRHSRLVPSWSLPILPDGKLEDNCSDFGSHTTQLLENRDTDKGKGKEKEFKHSLCDKGLAEQPTGNSPSPRDLGRSHVQLVSRSGRDAQSAIIVHCPPNCSHETCYCRPLVLSVQTTEPRRTVGPCYVDACVSPIITITGHTRAMDSPSKLRSKGPNPDGDHLHGFAGFTHISHRGIASETDVRSPIVKGTMIPMNATEMGRTR